MASSNLLAYCHRYIELDFMQVRQFIKSHRNYYLCFSTVFSLFMLISGRKDLLVEDFILVYRLIVFDALVPYNYVIHTLITMFVWDESGVFWCSLAKHSWKTITMIIISGRDILLNIANFHRLFLYMKVTTTFQKFIR